MLKQYFTDGLIQIAIVLSLLRTDLNNYLNSNYVNYPEVQELIQGQTVAYTQTNFHNSINIHLGSPEIYRKNFELDHDTIIREVRSFRPSYSPYHSNVSIPTFLLIGSNSTNILGQENDDNEVIEVENGDENNNIETESSSSVSLDELHQEGQNLLNTLEESLGAIAPLPHQGVDLSEEVLKDPGFVFSWERESLYPRNWIRN